MFNMCEHILNILQELKTMNVTKLLPENLKAAHNEILAALGSENNPSQWMEFCEVIDRHIPELKTQGRLSNQNIKSSLIGKLGFSSFKDYIESPIERGGLGWSSGGWNAYRRAWKIVEEYPYLRDMSIKSGWLNAFSHKLKKAEIEFPETLEEYNKIQDSFAEERASNKDAKLDDQAKLINQLEDTQLEFKFKLAETTEKLSNANAKIELFDSITEKHLNKIEQQAQKISELKNQLAKATKISRWEALKVAVFGN